MFKILIFYVLLLIGAFGTWFFMSSTFSKVGKPFKDQYDNFKNDMEEK